MEISSAAKLLSVCAGLFALGALLIGCVSSKTSPPRTTWGVIRSKTGVGGGTYAQQQVGAQRGFRASNEIPIAPSYSFEVQIEGLTDMGHCSLNTIAAEKFEVGQKVRVTYTVRGLKPIWSRVYVTSMEPVP